MMQDLAATFSPAIASRIGWALVQFAWQGCLVALELFIALVLLRRQRPALRYGLCCATLLVMLLLPVAAVLRAGPADAPGAAGTAAWALAAGQPGAAAAAAPVAAAGAGMRQRLAPALPWLFVLWLAGVAALSLYHLGGWLQVRRLTTLGTGPVPPRWQAVLARTCRRLSLSRPVRMLQSSLVPVPTAIGWLRPVVLVPASAFTAIPAAHLEAVLAHELAHIRRHDYLVNLLQAVVETLLFYHPAIWWVSYRTRVERELCCDDLAVSVCGDRLVYARALSELDALRAAPVLALAANTGPLLARIRRLVGASPARRRRLDAWLPGALTLTVLLAAAAAHLAAAQAGPGTARTGEDRGRPEAAVPDLDAASSPETVAGRWVAEEDGRQVRLQLTTYRPDGEVLWNSTLQVPAEEAAGRLAGPTVAWQIHREAGTFSLTGTAAGAPGRRRGAGALRFGADPRWEREIAPLGYPPPTPAKASELAVHDVDVAFIRELQDLGYEGLPLDRLIEFRVHGVGPDLIRALAELGYEHVEPARLVELQVHGVTPELIREIGELGYPGLPLERYIEMRTSGVTPALLREAAASGRGRLALDELLDLQAQRASEQGQ